MTAVLQRIPRDPTRASAPTSWIRAIPDLPDNHRLPAVSTRLLCEMLRDPNLTSLSVEAARPRLPVIPDDAAPTRSHRRTFPSNDVADYLGKLSAFDFCRLWTRGAKDVRAEGHRRGFRDDSELSDALDCALADLVKEGRVGTRHERRFLCKRARDYLKRWSQFRKKRETPSGNGAPDDELGILLDECSEKETDEAEVVGEEWSPAQRAFAQRLLSDENEMCSYLDSLPYEQARKVAKAVGFEYRRVRTGRPVSADASHASVQRRERRARAKARDT